MHPSDASLITAIARNTIRIHQPVQTQYEFDNFQVTQATGLLDLAYTLPSSISGDWLIFGSGTSVEQAPELDIPYDKYLKCCGVQTLKTMDLLSIPIDLTFCIDHTLTFSKIGDLPYYPPLIATSACSPDLINSWPAAVRILPAAGGIWSSIPHKSLIVQTLGTVSSLSLSHAIYHHAKTVTFLGHDFCWPSTRTHADGHPSQQLGTKPNELATLPSGMLTNRAYYASYIMMSKLIKSIATPICFQVNPNGLPIAGTTQTASPPAPSTSIDLPLLVKALTTPHPIPLLPYTPTAATHRQILFMTYNKLKRQWTTLPPEHKTHLLNYFLTITQTIERQYPAITYTLLPFEDYISSLAFTELTPSILPKIKDYITNIKKAVTSFESQTIKAIQGVTHG